jgi:hypothetical protein
MTNKSTRTIILTCIFLIGLIGSAIAIYTTANGPWGYTDPVEYISVAHSLNEGRGLAYFEGDAQLTPETIHPPLYSLVLSLVGIFGANLVVASRWVNIAAFFISIFLAGWIFYRYSPAPAFGIIASALMCTFPHMVVMFTSAYSEPLFILSILAGGWALLEYLQNEKLSLLIISALVVGTIPGTRYAGVAMVGAAALTVFLLASGRPWPRLKKTALFSLIAGLPILIWLAWVYFSSGHSLGGRIPELNPGGLSAQFQAFRGIFLDTVWKWVPFQSHETLLGYKLRLVLTGVIAILLLTLPLLAERHLRRDNGDRRQSGLTLFVFFGSSAIVFPAMLVLTYLFTWPTIDIDNRMMLPLFVCGVMTIFGALAMWQAAWFKRGWSRWLQVFPWLLAVLCLYWYIPQTIEKVEFFHKGDGMTAYRWNKAAIMQAVRGLPEEQPVISNDWELTTLWTGRAVYGFWTSFPATLPMQAKAYGQNEADEGQMLFCAEKAALVVYDDFPTQVRNNVGEAALSQIPDLFNGLTVYGRYPEGTIYLCP